MTAVWENELGGVTFAIGAGDEYVKTYPAEHAPLLTDEGYFADTRYPTIYDTDAHYLRTSMEALLMDTDFTTDASAPAE